MGIASVICIGIVTVLPSSLWTVWLALAAFMGTQVVCAAWRLLSGEGPWTGLNLLSSDPDRFLDLTPKIPSNLNNPNSPNSGSNSDSNNDSNKDNSNETSPALF